MRNFLLVPFMGLFATGLMAQENKANPKIEGSGNIVTKEIAVNSFDELDLQGVFSVESVQKLLY